MRLRTKLLLSVKHHLGLNPRCPHPEHRIVTLRPRRIELGAPRYRCLECWLSWSDAIELDSWSDV